MKTIDQLLERADGTEARLQKELPQIISTYKLTGLEKSLSGAMSEASGAYYFWWGTHVERKNGFGSKSKILAVKRALHTVLSGFGDDMTLNRILAVVPGSFREKRTWVRQSTQGLENLVKVVEHASTLDGRQTNGPRRDDIRAAAEPLRYFWTEEAEREETLYLREARNSDGVEYSETVQFLYACLRLIDDSVTCRMLVELDRSNGNT